MKKALPLLAVLLALAVVIAFTQRRAGGLGEKFVAAQAAQLAPADSIAFLELPDLDRSRARWKENELGAIANEVTPPITGWPQALRAFGDSTLRRAPGSPEIADLFSIVAATENLDPSGLFLAVTDWQEWPASTVAPLQKVIVGLPFRAKRTDVEAAVRAAKDRLFKKWPGAKSELSTHHGIEIETIASPHAPVLQPVSKNNASTKLQPGIVRVRVRGSGYSRPTAQKPVTPAPTGAPAPPTPLSAVHLAFRDDWLFFATDRALLVGTLDRYLRRPEAAPSLAQDPVFAECRNHGSADPDMTAWARWKPIGKAVAERLLRTSLPSEQNASNPLQAVLYTCALAGPQSRDRLYFHFTQAPSAPPLANRSIALTTPRTLGYATVNFDGLNRDGHLLRHEFWGWRTGSWRDFLSIWKNSDLPELGMAFGPEVALILEASPDGPWEDRVVALEVRDAVKARALAERTAAQLLFLPSKEAGGATRWGTTHWESPTGSNQATRWTMVLTKTHLLFSTSSDAATMVMKRAESGAPTLQDVPAHTAALQAANLSSARAPNGALLYLDAPRNFAQIREIPRQLLETFYQELGPFARTGNSGPYPADTRLLAAAFKPRLRPGSVTLHAAGPGWLAESTLGTVGNALLLFQIRGP